ncbi:MAG: TMEM165/GDT1 family protein [Bacillota bacterium]|nr:MAG: hypothetical protein DIU70_03275 [Bacillota bacterium]
MDLKAALVTFAIVFLAEVGDKTQLATMVVAANSQSPWMVFLGAAVALVLSALLGVLLGETITRLLPLHLLRTGAGLAFVLLGLLMLTSKG